MKFFLFGHIWTKGQLSKDPCLRMQSHQFLEPWRSLNLQLHATFCNLPRGTSDESKLGGLKKLQQELNDEAKAELGHLMLGSLPV